jgi:hypothetical protein
MIDALSRLGREKKVIKTDHPQLKGNAMAKKIGLWVADVS